MLCVEQILQLMTDSRQSLALSIIKWSGSAGVLVSLLLLLVMMTIIIALLTYNTNDFLFHTTDYHSRFDALFEQSFFVSGAGRRWSSEAARW